MKYTKQYDSCPIFRAVGKTKPHRENECEVCPFTANCPEDRFNSAVADIMGDIGGYIEKRLQDSAGKMGG